MATHGQRTLAGYSAWGHRESDMSEHARTHARTHTHTQILETFLKTFYSGRVIFVFFCSTYPENARYYVLELVIY